MTDVFVSKPNLLRPSQVAFWDELRVVLAGGGFRARTLGDTDYPNDAPVSAVLRVMRECFGAVVLGLTQVEAQNAISRRGTPAEQLLSEFFVPTPWNQLEGGIAFAIGLPLLIIREPGVAGGLFDTGSSDRFVHEADLATHWVRSEQFLQPFRQWAAEVEELSSTR